MKHFTITCEHCDKPNEFETAEVDGLDDFIESECSNAADDARDEERESMGDIADILIDIIPPRALHELSVAIRRSDRAEAEYWVDRIADELGLMAQEEVQRGRFDVRARAHA